MDHLPEDPGLFNNRHWAFLPTIRALKERGVDTILYIHPEGDETESDDLNEDFVQYADSGMRLCYATPRVVRESIPPGLGGLLDATERAPVRRETVFSYMLPLSGEGTAATYNQEAPAE
jgi:hypothetical protein